MTGLALVDHHQCRHEEAEPLCKRSLDIFEKMLDKNHLSAAPAINNLVWLWLVQGICEEANLLYQHL
ncbi:MAG: tetratricopeptide repeat protein [Candidatus Electronema sp. V4]|uniref:tetratricopeptide repeat protein n=1 Tax=Candidatus Electronema sp. V4 TaxID=3454756 RepID=UPI0040555CA4